VSTSPFVGLTTVWLSLLQESNATSQGGACLGDSGSPVLFEPVPGTDANLAVAVTTMVDAKCEAQNANQRLDTLEARTFLGRFVPPP